MKEAIQGFGEAVIWEVAGEVCAGERTRRLKWWSESAERLVLRREELSEVIAMGKAVMTGWLKPSD